MRKRNKCLILQSVCTIWQVLPGLWASPIPRCSSSLWKHQSPPEPSRVDCTCRNTGFSLQFSLACSDYIDAYHQGIWIPFSKRMIKSALVFQGFDCLLLSLIYPISLCFLQDRDLLFWRPLCYNFLNAFPLPLLRSLCQIASICTAFHERLINMKKSKLAEMSLISFGVRSAIYTVQQLGESRNWPWLHLRVWRAELGVRHLEPWNAEHLTQAAVTNWEVRRRKGGKQGGKESAWAGSWAEHRSFCRGAAWMMCLRCLIINT